MFNMILSFAITYLYIVYIMSFLLNVFLSPNVLIHLQSFVYFFVYIHKKSIEIKRTECSFGRSDVASMNFIKTMSILKIVSVHVSGCGNREKLPCKYSGVLSCMLVLGTQNLKMINNVKIGCMNVRGLAEKTKRQDVFNWLKQKKILYSLFIRCPCGRKK